MARGVLRDECGCTTYVPVYNCIMPRDTTLNRSSLGSSISGAVITLAVSNLLSKFLALVRIRVLAGHGGVGAHVDAYAFSFLIPELLNHFLAAGMLSITFIPIFQKYIVTNDRERAWYVFSNLLFVGTVACVLLIGAGMAYTAPIIRILSGVNIDNPSHPQQLALTVRLTRIILPAQICFFWGALLMGVQYSQKRFLFPSLSGVVYNAGIISGGVLLAPRIGIEGFSWGVLAGALSGNVALQLFGAIRSGMRIRPVFNLRDKDLKTYVLLTIPLILGLNLNFSNEFLFRFFGSRIPDGEGAIASLEYSWRLMFMIVSVFGQSLAAGFYPFISQLAVENKWADIHALMRSILVKIAAILAPVSGVAAVLAPSIITVLLRVGKFNEHSVAATAPPLVMYLIGTYFYAATPLIYRIFYARQNTTLPLAVNIGAVAACIPLYVIGSRMYGTAGIALASSICMAVQFFLIYGIYTTAYHNPYTQSTAKSLAVIAAVSAAAIIACKGIFAAGGPLFKAVHSPLLQSLATAAAAGIPPLAGAAAILHLSGCVDMKRIAASLLRRDKASCG